MNNKSFEEMVRFMGGVTVEEVYGTCAIKKEEIVVVLAKNVCQEAQKNGISKDQLIKSIEEQWK